MSESTSLLRIQSINWKWVGVGYCFFVVFHLMPTYLISGFALQAETSSRGIWLFLGLAIIAFYIGYRSRGVTIIEPAISAILYDLTLLFEFSNLWGRSATHSVGILVLWGLLTLVVTVTAAWLGELFQARRKARPV